MQVQLVLMGPTVLQVQLVRPTMQQDILRLVEVVMELRELLVAVVVVVLEHQKILMQLMNPVLAAAAVELAVVAVELEGAAAVGEALMEYLFLIMEQVLLFMIHRLLLAVLVQEEMVVQEELGELLEVGPLRLPAVAHV
jgi:hypothetical protein